MLCQKHVHSVKERLLGEGSTHAKNQGCVEVTRTTRHPIPDRGMDNH